ncbi:MAG: hypothetical protein MUF00_12720 [Gemmatimonadaceae bacterium]|jgi:hypothetical protein|nr:hypothetical protein [Gemmatimonadaceae bacterium]
MIAVKAKLKVVLQADEVVVAEVEDSGLWQRVLAAINAGERPTIATAVDLGAPTAPGDLLPSTLDASPAPDDAVGKLAHRLGLTREVVQGACSPDTNAPFLHLDVHRWEDMKRQTPARGPGSVSPIALASTLLALWFREANLGNPTQAQAQAVLATINLRDPNATRGIGKADWLQSRAGGFVMLNPANVSKATAMVKAFCSGKWKGEEKRA